MANRDEMANRCAPRRGPLHRRIALQEEERTTQIEAAEATRAAREAREALADIQAKLQERSRVLDAFESSIGAGGK